MAALNKVFMIGHLTGDPALKQHKGKPFLTFSIAVNKRWKGGSKVCFIDCTVWNKSAETHAKNLHEGSSIFLEGELEFEQWKKGGETRSKHSVIVDDIQYLPSGNKGEKQQEQG